MRSAMIIAALMISAPLVASDVYRSVDAEGNVVYSDRPEDGSAVKVAIAATAPSTPISVPQRSAAAAESATQEADDETVEAAERAQLAQDRAENCVLARQRAETYATSRRLYEVAEDGERVYYNDAELAQARLDAQSEVSRWCN